MSCQANCTESIPGGTRWLRLSTHLVDRDASDLKANSATHNEVWPLLNFLVDEPNVLTHNSDHREQNPEKQENKTDKRAKARKWHPRENKAKRVNDKEYR